MSKTLFNFYLDDELKQQATDKIVRLNGEHEKGQLASLIRVLLKQFVAVPDDDTDMLLVNAIEDEYQYCLKSSKRSKL